MTMLMAKGLLPKETGLASQGLLGKHVIENKPDTLMAGGLNVPSDAYSLVKAIILLFVVAVALLAASGS